MSQNKFNDLVELVKKLRKECPWDSIQTNDSIKAATLEEACEVLDAIDSKDFGELKKELGDLLLHVIFHTVIAEESGHFKIEEVIISLEEKLIHRHPHIFGDVKVEDHEEVKQNWEKLKLKEGRESVLDGIPKELPALLKAYRMQEKAAKLGFEWKTPDDAFKKISEEIEEINAELISNNSEKLEEEIGDLLFAITNFARQKKINSEDALRKAANKFRNRFQFMEKNVKESGRSLENLKLDEMLVLWAEAKKN